MPALGELRRDGDFVASTNNRGSMESATLAATVAALVPGTVLGKRTIGTATAAAAAGNTGNGAVSAVTVAAGAKVGVYRVMCIEPGTDAGQFVVEDPNGVIIGRATVGVAFSNQIGFTIADGATDFVAGDSFNVTVAAGNGQYQPLDLAATNGAAIAAGVLYGNAKINAGSKPIAVVARDAEVKLAALTWPDGITTDEKTAALAQLAALGVIAR